MMYNNTRAGMRLSTHPEGEPDPCAGYEHSRPEFYIAGRKERNMEEVVQIVTNLVSNVGFPIACVVAMFYMQNKEREAHKAESASWVEALNRNTDVMQKVLEKLGV